MMKSFALRKAPGMDGCPVEFDSTSWSKLAPLFIQMTSYMSDNLVLSKSKYQTIIYVILKPGKSGESPSDFRPISLINCDNKILTKLCGTSDSLIHAFWDCRKIQRIRVNTDDWLSDIFKVRFNFNPSVCILTRYVTGHSEAPTELDYSFFHQSY